MKGINILRLNNSTICEALQEYFDKRTTVVGRFKVKAIEFKNDGVSSVYQVTTEAVQSTGEPQPAAGEGRGDPS